MKIRFENDLGKIGFGKGELFEIIEAEGLGFLAKTRNITGFSGFDGQYCLGESLGARVITIKGDTKADERTIRKIIRILGESGSVEVYTNSGKRCIDAVCTNLEFCAKGRVYKEFIVQFTADYPFFTDKNYRTVNLFKRTKLIKSPFELPMVLSVRDSTAEIYNGGDIKTEPIFEITASSESAATDGAVVIENTVTGASLTILHNMTENERVTVSIPERTVVSDVYGDIASSLSNDSFLSDLTLERGENTIKVTNESGAQICAVCRYKNRYGECGVN